MLRRGPGAALGRVVSGQARAVPLHFPGGSGWPQSAGQVARRAGASVVALSLKAASVSQRPGSFKWANALKNRTRSDKDGEAANRLCEISGQGPARPERDL